MTIRELVLASMVALGLSGCSVSFMGTPTSSAPSNSYGYGWGGKPIASVDHSDGKPLHRGPSVDDDDAPPTKDPGDAPTTKPAERKKPAPTRTKPGDTRPDPTDDRPTRKPPTDDGNIDKPTRRPTDDGNIDKPTRKPPTRKPSTDDGNIDKPTRKPSTDGGNLEKPPTRTPPVIPAEVVPQRKPAPKKPVVDSDRTLVRRAPTR